MDNIKNKLVSDKNNTFFSDNKIIVGTQIPTEGTYNRGDLVVNVGNDNDDKPIWICVEGGSPGVWGPVVKEITMIDSSIIADGSIGLIKLADDVKEAIIAAGNIDLSGYATKDFVNNAISNIDLSVYATKEEVDSVIDLVTEIDLSPYATKEEVNNLLNNYATKQEVTDVLGIVGKIDLSPYATKTELNNAKNELNNAINNIDLSPYATKTELNNANNQLANDLALKQDKNDNNLQTNDKTIVGAINELFQSANNGKELIANAIGEPISDNDTFSAMSEKIDTLTTAFKSNLIECGVAVNSNDKLKVLIDKMQDIIRIIGGVGLRFAEGTALNMSTTGSQPTTKQTVQHNMRFVPTYIFVNIASAYTLNLNTNVIVSNLNETEINNHTYVTKVIIDSLTTNTFDITVTDNQGCNLSGFTWYAIGVGEEDTTVRDLLVEMLVKEGISVSDEDNILDLLEKIANALANQVVPAGTAVENNVLSGKTFINSTGNLITGKMTNQGNKTITPSTSTQTFPAGYYNSITVNPGSTIQHATGTKSISLSATPIAHVVNMNLSFTPNFIVVTIPVMRRDYSSCSDSITNISIINDTTVKFYCDWNGDTITANISNISSSSFEIRASNDDGIPIILSGTLTWHAFKL